MFTSRVRIMIIASIVILVMVVVALLIFQRIRNTDVTERMPDPITMNETDRLKSFPKNQLNAKNADAEIGYSKALQKFYIRRKTPQAQAAIDLFFKERNIKVDDKFIVETDRDVQVQIISDEFAADPTLPDPNTTDSGYSSPEGNY